LSLCTTAHPLCTIFANIFGTSLSEATMRPNHRSQRSRRPARGSRPSCGGRRRCSRRRSTRRSRRWRTRWRRTTRRCRYGRSWSTCCPQAGLVRRRSPRRTLRWTRPAGWTCSGYGAHSALSLLSSAIPSAARVGSEMPGLRPPDRLGLVRNLPSRSRSTRPGGAYCLVLLPTTTAHA
jgi:hypothetical protein